jgi:acylpyruvate hydrolase
MTKAAILLVGVVLITVFGSSGAEALKLVTYASEGETRLGAVVGAKVIDLNRAHRALLEEQGEPRAKALADAIVPPDMLEFLQGEARSMKAAEEAVAFALARPASGLVKDLARVRLKAPVPRPTKLTLMALNYRAHAAEMLAQVPPIPTLFAAYPSAVIGPDDPIVIPTGTDMPDYEAELGVVIGKRGKRVSSGQAMDYVAGYVIVNDVTARDWQERTSQFLPGKTPDTFKAMGPYLVTRDEVPDSHRLDIRLWVNNELRQESNTALQVFKVPEVIAYMSTIWTLEPGDVLSTGTPPGVGHARTPPAYLKPGDRVRIEVSGLGVLENPVSGER